ncbi:Glucose-repressible alcohol dehydrogenase transcriptional effector [Grifola frondosa]|uniref:Glucose-repressible alcohol dehydrogenase transcriptional effector n=1 Tax=Grifola frondosa TaxID=5627 RepID=A0A1C7M1W4_GRIFR|nr:Glucose-repressible alcohol dehydrogenase transcriptional effector [Grifola frondosa]
MYFTQQSPGIAHKLPTHQHPGQVHDQSPWSRAPHLPVFGPPTNAQPTSPAYPLFTHANGPHVQLGQGGSPGSVPTQIITPHWQQQLLKCEMIRASRSPHHRARASAMASRTVQKSAIPITNPNAIKPVEINGTSTKDVESVASTSPSTPSGAPAESSPTSVNASANHPSSTVAPIADTPRPTAPRPPVNTWQSLDMGGVGIKNIPPTSGLFAFTFLSNLYLNHNSLTSIPPQISKLRHLELLDLSGTISSLSHRSLE